MRASRPIGRSWRLAILGIAVCAGCRADVRRPATRGADAVDALATPLAASPAPLPPQSEAALSGLTAAERRGQTVYGTYCWSCHGLYGHGDGPGARGVAGELPDLGRIAAAASPEEMIRRLRREGADSGPPAWHDLKAGEIAAAAAYVATFAPRSRGNPSAGRLIYESYCERCHGARGAGDGRLAPTLSPPPADLRALDLAHQSRRVFETLRVGGQARHGGLMPGWGSSFGDRELWDVMAYLRVLAASR